jgi:hypothetical protein
VHEVDVAVYCQFAVLPVCLVSGPVYCWAVYLLAVDLVGQFTAGLVTGLFTASLRYCRFVWLVGRGRTLESAVLPGGGQAGIGERNATLSSQVGWPGAA